MLQETLRRLRVRWRRRRLLRAYSRVFEVRTGKRVGLSPTMWAYQQAEQDSLLTLREDGDVEWHWPSDGRSEEAAAGD